jgi:hypothetical protein
MSQALRCTSPEVRPDATDNFSCRRNVELVVWILCTSLRTNLLGILDFSLVDDEVVRVGPPNFERRCQCVGETWGKVAASSTLRVLQ